jgi:hypothetical protein
MRDAIDMGISWAPQSNMGDIPPDGTPLSYYLRGAASGSVRLTILDSKNVVVSTIEGPAKAGINRVWWSFERDGAPAPANPTPAAVSTWHRSRVVAPGVYTVKLSVDGRDHLSRLILLADPTAAPR